MNKRILALLVAPLLITSCGGSSSDNYEHGSTSIEETHLTGEISAFNLLTPENDFSTNTKIDFTWEAANNAEYYQIEISADPNFYNDKDAIYMKESNITLPKYTLSYSLPKKDIEYYWRVTAVNHDHTKVSNQMNHFFFESVKEGEIYFLIEDEQDWAVHKDGCPVEVSIDRSNFFNNDNETGKDSLVISFDHETMTHDDDIARTGWAVVTNSESRELYGTDALFFNFFYAGQEATIFIRVLDDDGEYWQYPVQISNNSKQTIIARYEDFVLRDYGPNVYDHKFGYERISAFEVVFEATHGDGICILSNVRAVKFADYSYMFMTKFFFDKDEAPSWKQEHYAFEYEISDDETEMKISHKKKADDADWKGYGYQHVNIFKYFTLGDALRFKVKYTGDTPNATFYFRLYEEDTDIWQFKTGYSYLISDDYKEIVIPLKSLLRMDSMTGDGGRQFYFINKFSFGVAGALNYSGTLALKDLELIDMGKAGVYPTRTRTIGFDGIIDDFENYDLYTKMYYNWNQSNENKDEAIKLESSLVPGDYGNNFCAEFDYKADMYPAVYNIDLDTKLAEGKNAFQIWLRDNAIRSKGKDYPAADKVSADMTIQLLLDTGEQYRAHIECVNKDWTVYTFLFNDESAFELANKDDFFDGDYQPLTSEHIVNLGFSLQFYYLNEKGEKAPTYAIANPLYVDNIALVNATSTSVEVLPYTIFEEPEDSGLYPADTFEGYASDADLHRVWRDANPQETEWDDDNDPETPMVHDESYFELSTEHSTQGGTQSIKMHYVGTASISYSRGTIFGFSTQARGISLDIKANKRVKIMVNLNVGTTYKVRYEITPSTKYTDEEGWYRWFIGFDNFKVPKDSDYKDPELGLDTCKIVDSISFGAQDKEYWNKPGNFYVDNIRFIKDVDYEAVSWTKIS